MTKPASAAHQGRPRSGVNCCGIGSYGHTPAAGNSDPDFTRVNTPKTPFPRPGTMDLSRLNQKQVCLLLERDERTIRNYAKEDPAIPSHGSGKQLYYVWNEVFEWWRNREFKSLIALGKRFDDEYPDTAVSERKDAAIKAEMRLLDLAAKKKSLVVLTDIETRVAARISQCMIQLHGVANRLRSRIVSENAALVAKEINRSCDVLASGKQEDAAA